eukprot:6178563-Pleurochrysis_carterae.AAC.4
MLTSAESTQRHRWRGAEPASALEVAAATLMSRDPAPRQARKHATPQAEQRLEAAGTRAK